MEQLSNFKVAPYSFTIARAPGDESSSNLRALEVRCEVEACYYVTLPVSTVIDVYFS